ncbi:MAG: DMT family transporter [Chloroflexi bacterium]|nr:DMT family transporter [Chloroflexota bacterium]
MAIALALFAMLVGGVADFIYKEAQRRGIDEGVFVFYQATTFFVLVWVLTLSTGQLETIAPAAWKYGLPSGLLAYTGVLLFLKSLKGGDASVNVPIFRLSFVVTALGAILFLGESITAFKIAGFLLAVTSILSLAKIDVLIRGQMASGPLLRLVVGTVLFGVSALLVKQALNEGGAPITLASIQTITFNLSALFYTLISRKMRANSVTLRFAPLVGLFQLSWVILLFQSLKIGDASVSYPIVQLSFVVTVLLTVITLREAMTPNKVLGLGTALLSVLAFSLGKGW